MESGDLENRDFLSTSSRESLTDELNWTRGCMKKENRRGVKLGKRERERRDAVGSRPARHREGRWQRRVGGQRGS